MRVPLKWLADYVRPEEVFAASDGVWPTETLVDRLVMTGTEVEAVHKLGPPSPDGYVVGHVTAVEPHPDADRLRVCRVDTGEKEPRTIVCGAPNVAAGQSVAVALPGAVLPGGRKLGEAKLRGVASAGMILSEPELELGPDADGILVLSEAGGAPAPGTPLAEVLPLGETVLELEVTPNRTDCFGVFGIAREVHAITGAPLVPEPWAEDAPAAGESEGSGEGTGGCSVDELASVRVEVPELCPRFTARAFTEVTVAPSPPWLRARLTAAGQRPINNVVDITNYVMLLTGQPLHAFDLDRVQDGELIVRGAGEGEAITTLDGVERDLDAGTVLVCDQAGPAAIAGIMGGAGSEVGEHTTRVLLEVANWDGPDILAASRRLALRSEASSRFEKQLHPALCDRAQRIASRLLVELCGAEMASGMIDVDAGRPAPREVALAADRAERLIGVPIPVAEQTETLTRLGFGVAESAGELRVTVPPDRHYDVTREADLVEEVGRVHGYDDEHLPPTLPRGTAGSGAEPGGLSRAQALRRRAEEAMCGLGFNEIVGWSFTDPAEAERLRLSDASASGSTAGEPAATTTVAGTVTIANPLSAEQSVLRTTLLGSMLDAAALNAARGAARIAVFESGRVYFPGPGELRAEPDPGGRRGAVDGSGFGSGPPAGEFVGLRGAPAREPHRLGALVAGPLVAAGWDGRDEAGGFFALKGVLEALAARLGTSLEFTAAAQPFLHPGRAAAVSLTPAGSGIGWIGELHPGVVAEWDLQRTVVAFELDLGPLLQAATVGEEIFEDVTSYPAVLQDLAVVIADETPAVTVRESILSAGAPLLRRADVFDLYRGEQLGSGRKSLALRLEFRAEDRTLDEDEVGRVRVDIEAAIEKIGGSIRE